MPHQRIYIINEVTAAMPHAQTLHGNVGTPVLLLRGGQKLELRSKMTVKTVLLFPCV